MDRRAVNRYLESKPTDGSVQIQAGGITRGSYILGPDGTWAEVVDYVEGETTILVKPDRGEPYSLPLTQYVWRMRGV